MKITTVLAVEQIEKSMPFWVDRMGFSVTGEVPDGDRLGFLMLEREGAELMVQSVESIAKDAPQFVPGSGAAGAMLFIEVSDFADVLQRLQGYPIALEERTTFYGMREIGVREPGGHVVVFAMRTGT